MNEKTTVADVINNTLKEQQTKLVDGFEIKVLESRLIRCQQENKELVNLLSVKDSIIEEKVNLLLEKDNIIDEKIILIDSLDIQLLDANKKIENNKVVDIIVPVYSGLLETQECIESTLATMPSWAELVVINDCSPDSELTNWLRIRAANREFVLLENEVNLGFVATVNRGMQLNLTRDVLLLNSDVEVANDWLERIRDAAYSRKDIGSITPFSNNATICSFPNFCEDNELFLGLSVTQLDNHFSTVGTTDNLVHVPTGVGFCMYIRRDCLNHVGYFDVETFGRGYGEENDWCQRAEKLGWPNFHQLNVFVYHKGGVSFAGEQSPRKTRALELLNELHPNYTRDVMQFIANDPAKDIRQQMIFRMLAAHDCKKVLLISHKMGGGVKQHIQELASFYSGKVHFLLLTPAEDLNSISLSLFVNDSVCREKITINIDTRFNVLVDILKIIGIGHIHFHHTIDLTEKIFGLAERLKCSYDITIHDYYYINANPTLTDRNGLFVGDGTNDRDELCAVNYPIPGGITANEWRNKHKPWLEGAVRIIFPSADVKERFTREYPSSTKNSIIALHPDFESKQPYPEAVFNYTGEEPLKVLVLGAISREKGALLFEEVASSLKGSNIEFHLLGYAFRTLGNSIITHGSYNIDDIDSKLSEIQPDVIWFPAQWPETYSYTLSIALEKGLPVVVPNLGAFPERVSGRQFSRVITWDIKNKEMKNIWLSLLSNPTSFFDVAPVEPALALSDIKYNSDFYKNQYVYDNWKKSGELGRIDIKSILQSMPVEIVPVINMSIDSKEKFLVVLWRLSNNRLLSWGVKFVPYRVQRYIKRRLSRRAIHDILNHK